MTRAEVAKAIADARVMLSFANSEPSRHRRRNVLVLEADETQRDEVVIRLAAALVELGRLAPWSGE